MSMPTQTAWHRVSLLGKPDLAERPISITSQVEAVHAKHFKSITSQWGREHHGFWGTAVAGCSARQASLRRRLRAEVAYVCKQDCVEHMFDIEKFDNSIDPVLLV